MKWIELTVIISKLFKNALSSRIKAGAQDTKYVFPLLILSLLWYNQMTSKTSWNNLLVTIWLCVIYILDIKRGNTHLVPCAPASILELDAFLNNFEIITVSSIRLKNFLNPLFYHSRTVCELYTWYAHTLILLYAQKKSLKMKSNYYL